MTDYDDQKSRNVIITESNDLEIETEVVINGLPLFSFWNKGDKKTGC